MPRRAIDADEDVLRLPDGVRRTAELAGVSGVPRSSRNAPGAEREGDRVHRADRAGPGLPDRRALAVPSKELLLSGYAQELSDLAVRPADLHRRAPRGRSRSPLAAD